MLENVQWRWDAWKCRPPADARHATWREKSFSIISKPLSDWRWCETVMVARLLCEAGDPIGTPESPQSAAVPRTANKCCQKRQNRISRRNWNQISRRRRQKDFLLATKLELTKKEKRQWRFSWGLWGGGEVKLLWKLPRRLEPASQQPAAAACCWHCGLWNIEKQINSNSLSSRAGSRGFA